MAIEFWLERPPGSRTSDKELLPSEQLRLAGKVKGSFGLPEPFVGVRIELNTRLGTRVDSWEIRTDILGSFYVDTRAPSTPDTYVATAVWSPYFGEGEAASPLSFTVTMTPVNVGPRIERTISPSPAILGTMVRVTCSVYVDGAPQPNANVEFYVWKPSGVLLLGKVDSYTDSRGIAWVTFNASDVGQWRVVVNVPAFTWGQFAWLEVIPQPVVEKPKPKPKPKGNVNWLIPAGIGAGLLLLLIGRGK